MKKAFKTFTLLLAVIYMLIIAGCSKKDVKEISQSVSSEKSVTTEDIRENDISKESDSEDKNISDHIISEEERVYRDNCMPLSDLNEFYNLYIYDSSDESYSPNEEYLGKAMMFEGKIKFSFDLTGQTAYMLNTLSESGSEKDSLIVLDIREDKDFDLTEGSIITVYGDYSAAEPATKEMRTFSAVIPRFDMRYAERK